MLARAVLAASGQALIEGMLVVPIIVLAVVLCIEMTRRAQIEMLFHHAAFLSARSRLLGGQKSDVDETAKRFLRHVYGHSKAQSFFRSLDITDENDSGALIAKYHLRYPMLTRFSMKEGTEQAYTKHHLEVTKTCLFPYY